MVSWNNSESSDESPLSFASEPYIPDTTEDPEWNGLVPGKVCNHNALVEKAVVFEGANTGRRFYGCAEKEGYNCGLIEWVDNQWLEPLQNALRRLWDMYEQSTKQVKDKEEMIAKIAEEKGQLEDKHQQYIKENKNFFARFHNNLMLENYQGIMVDSDLQKALAGCQEVKSKIEKENLELKKEVEVLKHIQVAQAQVIRNWKKGAAVGQDVVKQEKKKLEYVIADLLKDGEENKTKLKKIKAICDE